MSAVNTGRRTRSLGSDALENVVHEGVEDGHSLVRDTRVRVDLLEDYRAKTRQPTVFVKSRPKTIRRVFNSPL